jgi:hypothetical protein
MESEFSSVHNIGPSISLIKVKRGISMVSNKCYIFTISPQLFPIKINTFFPIAFSLRKFYKINFTILYYQRWK